MSPSLGQAMNIGMKDIAVLVAALANSDGEVEQAASHYSCTRIVDVHAAVTLSVRASKINEASRVEIILAGALRRLVQATG
jgi:2-polyprenyl-6-methoxyphenol hydroxylase-like FAD-dependent oxidoreductase